MTKWNKHAPGNLPPAVSDLVAEGGNVLASDDRAVPDTGITYVPTRHLRLSKTGQWIARVVKS